MTKKYIITEEEFEAIKKAIENELQLWQYNIISASNKSGHELGMNKKTFFEGLRREFIIR